MRAVWKCGLWELRGMEQENLWVVLLLVPLQMSANIGSMLLRDGSIVISALLLAAVVALAVVRSAQWLFGETFALERTSARAAWQSIGGRLLCWTLLMVGGELVRQLFLWASMERDIGKIERLQEIGLTLFGPQEAEKWLGAKPFLMALCLAVGIYVLALTVFLLVKSGWRRHRAKISDAASGLLLVGVMIWLFWSYLRFPLVPLAVVCILLGLPLSCWLLEHKAE